MTIPPRAPVIATAGAGAASHISKLRFLIVEDQAFQRAALGSALRTLGALDIVQANDGRAALELYRRAEPPFDIIVSDLDMPGMDGMQFIRHLAELGRPLSLILASGLERTLVAAVEGMARAYGVHLLGAIDKPATPAKLLALIERHGALLAKAGAAPLAAFTAAEIEEGLARDEFMPYFQPKVNLATGEVKGAEALARWAHPREGLTLPGRFVAELEKGSGIVALTQMMLRKSAAACASWRAAGSSATVAVNVSIASLAETGAAERMTAIVMREGIAASDVVVELTESAAASHLGKVLENLSRLRMNGFGLSIDDYGTGYASMQQLARIAFTELKIDQSFVRNSAQPSSRAILESSLEMSAKLDLTAVAEGIETQAEWDLLLALGCQLGQGYLIARPMTAADILRWIRERPGSPGATGKPQPQ